MCFYIVPASVPSTAYQSTPQMNNSRHTPSSPAMQLGCWYSREELDTSSQELWDFMHKLTEKRSAQLGLLVGIMFLPDRTYELGEGLVHGDKWASVLIQNKIGNHGTAYTFTYRRKADGGFIYQFMESSDQSAVETHY